MSKCPLDWALGAMFVLSTAAIFLAHEDPFVRNALCSQTNICPEVAHVKALNKIFYDLAVGALISLIFYALIVRLPDYQKRQRIKRSLSHQYQNFREDCTRIMLIVSDGTYDAIFLETLLDQKRFRAYFKESVSRDQDRWNAFENNLDEYNLKELTKRLQIFRDEIAFALNNIEIPSEKPFEFLKRLTAAIYSVQDTTLGYDETKPLSRFLWDIFAGFDFITGYRERDIIKEMIESI